MIIKLAHAEVGHRMRLARIAFLAMLAAIGCLLLPAGTASAAIAYSSFDAGTLEPGQVVHKVWNNANSDAYAVGLVTTKLNPERTSCTATLLRTWYDRRPDGMRRFHMEIQGDHFDRCQVTVWMARPTALTTLGISNVAPGASVAKKWNNAHSDKYVYLVGVVPSTPKSGTCAFELTTRYRTLPSEENEFSFTSTNIGNEVCSATLNLVSLPVTNSEPTGSSRPGFWIGWGYPWNNPTRIVVPGMDPQTLSSGNCEYTMDTSTRFYGKYIDFGYTNTGLYTCKMTLTVAVL